MKKLSRNEVEKMGREELMALAKEEMLLKSMRESLLSTGSVLPALERMQMLPMEATQPDVRPVKARRPVALVKSNKRDKWTAIEQAGGSVDWTKKEKTCPKCDTTKPIIPDFGLRNAKEGVRPHSWCKTCRGKKERR